MARRKLQAEEGQLSFFVDMHVPAAKGVQEDDRDDDRKAEDIKQTLARLVRQAEARFAAMDEGYGIGLMELQEQRVTAKKEEFTAVVRPARAHGLDDAKKLPKNIRMGLEAHRLFCKVGQIWVAEGLKFKANAAITEREGRRLQNEDKAHEEWREWCITEGAALKERLMQEWFNRWGHIPGWWNPYKRLVLPEEVHIPDEDLL